MVDIIKSQDRPIGVLITALHEHRPCKKIDMVDTRSNIKLAELNYKNHGGKSLRDLVDCAVGECFYNPPGSDHHKLICIDRFHITTPRQVHSRDKPYQKQQSVYCKKNEVYNVLHHDRPGEVLMG